MLSNSIAGIGSRETPKEILVDMRKLGRWCRTAGIRVRSGHAEGADWAFEQGAQSSCTAYIPWVDFNSHLQSQALKIVPDFTGLHIKTLARMYHPKYDELTQGAQKMMMRNICQVLGEDLKSPVAYVVCWTKDGKASGGTGQAIRCAQDRGILVRNLFRHPFDVVIDELRGHLL